MSERGAALVGKRILVTGPTGQVAKPLTLRLAKDNEVWGAARFKDGNARDELEAAGVKTIPLNLVEGDLSAIPDSLTHVLNLAVVKSGNWDRDLDANAVATGLLMHRVGAQSTPLEAFLHCSSTGVYEANGRHPHAETDPLGDNHRVIMPTYSISKIAAEAAARFGARAYNIPTVISRLNVPYGDHGGWPAFHLLMILNDMPVPVHVDGPSVYNPIHDDDIHASLPLLLAAASVPATTVNWCGDQEVALEDWCAELGRLVGKEATFDRTTNALESVVCDRTKMNSLGIHSTVDWRDGMRRLVQGTHPHLLG